MGGGSWRGGDGARALPPPVPFDFSDPLGRAEIEERTERESLRDCALLRARSGSEVEGVISSAPQTVPLTPIRPLLPPSRCRSHKDRVRK